MAQVFETRYHIKHDRESKCISRDVVPRLPEYPFRHAGHSIQIDQSDESCCLAFYHHEGELFWGSFLVECISFVWLPSAIKEHRSAYAKNLMKAKPVDEDVPCALLSRVCRS